MTTQEQFLAEITARISKEFATQIQEVEMRLRAEIQKQGCPIERAERRAIPDLYSMIRELGEGDSRRGITRIRRYFLFIESLYTKKSVVTGAIFTLTVLSLMGWIVMWSWRGMVDGFKGALGLGQ